MTQLTIPDKLRIFNHDIDNWRYETDSQRVTWTRFAILVFTPWARVYLFNGGQSWESPFSCLEQVSKLRRREVAWSAPKVASHSEDLLWQTWDGRVVGVVSGKKAFLSPARPSQAEQPAWNWAHITRSPFLSTFCTVLYVAIWRQTTNGKCIVIEVWGSSNIVLSKN